MTLKEEMKSVEETGGIYIQPYKLNEMMKLSGKIIKLLTENTTVVSMCYRDMKIVMQMVDDILSHAIQHTQGSDDLLSVMKKHGKVKEQ